MEKYKLRKSLSDFDRFKAMVLRKQRSYQKGHLNVKPKKAAAPAKAAAPVKKEGPPPSPKGGKKPKEPKAKEGGKKGKK